MIKYTLKCDQGHEFDSWFGSATDFDTLLSASLVTCSICGTLGVEKTIMAPQVSTARTKSKPGALSAPASPAEHALAEMRKQVEANSENVGENFATEARKIHEGDAPARSIIGEAKVEDAKALVDDGVAIVPLPWGRKRTN